MFFKPCKVKRNKTKISLLNRQCSLRNRCLYQGNRGCKLPDVFNTFDRKGNIKYTIFNKVEQVNLFRTHG